VIGFIKRREDRFHTRQIGRSGFRQIDGARCASKKRRADFRFQGGNKT
jgi:hypothetical protein